MKTLGFGKFIRERKCYVIETDLKIKVVLAGKAPSLSDYQRRFKKTAMPPKITMSATPEMKIADKTNKLIAATHERKVAAKRDTKSEHKMTLRQRRNK